MGGRPCGVVLMTAESIVPGLVHRVRDTNVLPAQPLELSGLPLPRLATLPSERPILYGMAALDGGGRIGDRRILRALDWPPDHPLDITSVGDAVLVRPDENGAYRRPSGLLALLPAPVRHWCLLSPGDRVLLVADLERDVLVVHSMATLDRLVLAHHAAVFGGDHA